MSDDEEGSHDIHEDFPLTALKLKGLDAVPPLPLFSQEGASTITRDNISERNDVRDRHIGVNRGAVTSVGVSVGVGQFENKTSSDETKQIISNLHLVESPMLNRTVSLTEYIQTAQIELDQMKKQVHTQRSVSPSPKTPCKEVVSPELVDYIRSAEKEMEKLVKETLYSPVKTVKTISSSSLEDAGEVLCTLSSPVDEVKKKLSEHGQFMDFSKADSHAISRNEGDNIICTAERKECENDSVQVGNHSRGRKVYSLYKSMLRAFFMAMLFIQLSCIYPVSPLLNPQSKSTSAELCLSNLVQDVSTDVLNQCLMSASEPPYLSTERLKVGLATFSFGVATSIRTIVLAPFQRIDGKIQSRQQNFHVISRFLKWCNYVADLMEQCSYNVWEDAARYHGVLEGRALSREPRALRHPPELDLGLLIPCNRSEARVQILQNGKAMEQQTGDLCHLRDVIDRDLLMAYAKINFDSGFTLATHPMVLRNLWPRESFEDAESNQRRLTPLGILTDPQLSHFILPNYFADATKTGYAALVPDSNRISVSQFVTNIMTGISPHAKIGTQTIVEEYSELRHEIVPSRVAKDLFGWNPWLDDLKERMSQYFGPRFSWFLKMLPSSTYYPIFIAGIADASDAYSRTDLHTEPIGNIAVQMHGYRHWTLIPTQWTGLLRPSVSKHGRGYVYSSLDPIVELPKRLGELPLVWDCVTHRGDALWVPPWMWHRIDYKSATAEDENKHDNLSIGASVFHFYPKLFAINFPLFAAFILPNLIFEVFGFNTE
ncbi:hypothetical protein ACHAWX_006075 [Stephanocyclus meneghinianus]